MLGLVASMLLVGVQAVPVGAASGGFGARLTTSTAPSNAEGGRECSENGEDIPEGSTCTWVAFRSHGVEGRQAAPKDGTIRKVKLISCVGGRIELQRARYRASDENAKVIRTVATIDVQADPRETDDEDLDTFCGGEDGDDYIIQTFRTNFLVKRGDVIAVKAATLGTLYCSGDNGVNLYSPALAAGGGFREPTDETGCMMLIRFVYG
jgi:hypothetical protein